MGRYIDVVGIFLLGAAIYVVLPLSDAIVLGAVTAYGLRVLVERLSTTFDRKIVEYVLLTGVVVVPIIGLYMLVTNISSVTVELIQLNKTLIANIQTFLQPYDLPVISNSLSEAVVLFGGYIRSLLFNIVAALPWVVIQIFTYLLVVYYLYGNGDVIHTAFERIIDRLPQEDADLIRGVVESITDLIRKVFVVYGTFGIIMGVIAGLGYYIIGLVVTGSPIPFYWVWGILIGMTAFIEGLGSLVVTGPLMAYYFAVGEIGLFLWLVGFQAVFLTIVPAFLLPYLGSARLNVSFFTMLLGLMAGPVVFGLKGFILGPIFIITLKQLVIEWLDAETSRQS